MSATLIPDKSRIVKPRFITAHVADVGLGALDAELVRPLERDEGLLKLARRLEHGGCEERRVATRVSLFGCLVFIS